MVSYASGVTGRAFLILQHETVSRVFQLWPLKCVNR